MPPSSSSSHNPKKRKRTSSDVSSRCGAVADTCPVVEGWEDRFKAPTPSIKYSHSQWSVYTLIQKVRNGEIDLNPPYQRSSAWKEKQNKVPFINSVWKGYDINPIKFILEDTAQKKTGTSMMECADGKNRLEALIAYVGNEFGAAVESPDQLELFPILKRTNGRLFNQLDQDVQNYFLSVVIVPLMILDPMTSAQKADYFTQTNKGLPVSASEKIHTYSHHGVVKIMDASYKANEKEYLSFIHIRQRDRATKYNLQANILAICMDETNYIGRDDEILKWCRDRPRPEIQNQKNVVEELTRIIGELANIFGEKMDSDVRTWWVQNAQSRLPNRPLILDMVWILKYETRISVRRLREFAVDVRYHTMRFKAENQKPNRGDIRLGVPLNSSEHFAAKYASDIFGQTNVQYNKANRNARVDFIKSWYQAKKTDEKNKRSS